tara:strand:- start:22 stop:1194 length:1173 start_codon:yes stop_codon:yes gene_type:complete
MASRLTKDGIKLSQSSDLAATSVSTIVPLNLDEGSYWNFNGQYTVTSNASSTPTAEDLRASAAWNTGVSSNLVITFTYYVTQASTIATGGFEILSETGSDGKTTIKDVKLEVSSDAVNYTTVVDDVTLPEDSNIKPAYVLLPTESIDSIGHPHKVNNSGHGYNHFRLTIKNGYSSDNIRISQILLRQSSLKFTVTEESNWPAVFSKKTNLISTGEISTDHINLGTGNTSLTDKISSLQSVGTANASAISNISSTLSMSDFTTNLFLDLTLVSTDVVNNNIFYGPSTVSSMTHTVTTFQNFKTNAAYINQHSLKIYSGDSTHEIVISDLLSFNTTGPTLQNQFNFQYDNESGRDGISSAYFVGNDLVFVVGVGSGGGYHNVRKIYRIDIIR